LTGSISVYSSIAERKPRNLSLRILGSGLKIRKTKEEIENAVWGEEEVMDREVWEVSIYISDVYGDDVVEHEHLSAFFDSREEAEKYIFEDMRKRVESEEVGGGIVEARIHRDYPGALKIMMVELVFKAFNREKKYRYIISSYLPQEEAATEAPVSQ